MSHVKFEVFSPGAEERESQRKDIARRIAEAYRDGHAKGFAQGAEASAREHAEEQSQLRAQFVEALRDAQITQVVAQREAIDSLLPLVSAMTAGLAPALAESGLVATLEKQLREALASRPDTRPRIHCAPEIERGVARALTQFADRYELIADESLTPLEARVHWDQGFDEIDFESCLAAMRNSIAQFRDAARMTQEESEAHAG